MNKYTVIYIAFVCLLVSCKNQTDIPDNTGYFVNLDELKPKDTIHLSSCFKSATPIVLETNEACLIKEIRIVQIVDSFIFIFDNEMETLFVFNKSGKFVRQIGNMGPGPMEYESLSDFTIDREERKIYLFDKSSMNIKVYDFNGIYLTSFNCERKMEGWNLQVQYVSRGLFGDFRPFNPSIKEDVPLLLKFNCDNGGFESSLLSADKYNLGFKKTVFSNDGVFHRRTSENPVFIPVFSHTVFSLQNEVSPYLSLYSRNFISESELKDIDMSAPDASITLYKSENVLHVHSYVETDNHIFLSYGCGIGNSYELIFSKKDESARLCHWLVDDLVYKSGNSVTHYPYSDDGKGVYKIIRYRDLPTFLDLVKSGETKLTAAQVAEISALPEDTNPILFYYEEK